MKTLMKPDGCVAHENPDSRGARILLIIILATMAVFLFVVAIALLVWHDAALAAISFGGAVVMALPLTLILRGHREASGLALLLSFVCAVTLICMVGQGIHDITILTYPVVVIIGSLILGRRHFLIVSALTLAAVAWLTLGESHGLFSLKPIGPVTVLDFMIMASILLVAILAADLLARDMRSNLERARSEITRRKATEERLRHQSIHDSLTGIYNRAMFEEEVERFERNREFPVSIIVADVDDLKITNDTAGH
ncbi:MAG TPA: GGDEF domain-containing protein, partial [Rectinemataceae bacterium]|nr:GGDEF domain-containing protein [Rectinemataceae bacterium]